MTRTLGCLGLVVSFCAALIIGPADLGWAQSCERPVARAASVQGTVEVRRGGAASWQPVKLNDKSLVDHCNSTPGGRMPPRATPRIGQHLLALFSL